MDISVLDRLEALLKAHEHIISAIEALSMLAAVIVSLTLAHRATIADRTRLLAVFQISTLAHPTFSPYPRFVVVSITNTGKPAFGKRTLRVIVRPDGNGSIQRRGGGQVSAHPRFFLEPDWKGRLGQREIRHRPRRGDLHVRLRPLQSVLHAGHFGDDERAPYVLDGLLHHVHQSDLRIYEDCTDTAGTTDYVFGLCHLLGSA
jgi:hypothetical protein